MSDHKKVADFILHASSRRDLLMRRLGQLTGGPEGKQREDEINREIDRIERDIWGLAIRAARAIHADDKEITQLRARATCLSGAAGLFADVMKCRDDGPWRDVAAFRARWAVPEDQTVEAFCKQFIASAIRHAEARS